MVVLFDFDEVFVDLNTGALKYINNALGTKYTMEDVTSWEFFDEPTVRKPFFEYLSLPDVYQKHVIPNQNMINVLKQMVEMGKEVYIVTASVESSQDSKYRFIKENMSFFDTKNLFTVNNSSKYKNKSDVLDELQLNYHEPIVLVDDGIHNILDMMADINHKTKLDDMMKKFYINRTLKKFNNPYHEFIYGIVPELSYNRNIDDGKRIFKLQDTKDIWGLLKNIENQHKNRVENKQAEIFNYLNNIVNDLLPGNVFKETSELQNNVVYMTKHILSGTNKHSTFLSEVAGLSVKVEKVFESLNDTHNLDTLQKSGVVSDSLISNIHKLTRDTMFKSADKKFGSNVMYNEVKNLVLLHGGKHLESQQIREAQEVSENYFISQRQMNLFSNNSFIKDIMEISKENLIATKNIVENAHETSTQEKLQKLLHKAGIMYDIDFSDRIALTANVSLAFNKNYCLDKSGQFLEAKDDEIEEIRQEFINYNKQLDLFVNKKLKP